MIDSDLLAADWRGATREVNGLALHVVEAGPPDGPLLMLLHGFPEFWWDWRRQIAAFAAAGYRVVVPDLRGYNASDAPQAISAYRLETLVADVLALADACGAGRLRLVGHDWGAVVAWWVAATRPERLERVVVIDGPHPDTLARQAMRHPTQALRSSYVAFFQLPWLPEAALGAFDHAVLKAMLRSSAAAHAFEPGALDRYAVAWSRPGRLTAMLNDYRALRERAASPAPRRIAPPTLVLWGGADRFLELHVAKAGLALCDAGRLVVLDGASHWLHLEQPDRVNAEVLRFLAEGQHV